jgi:acetylornithine deacetylase/succinyl-diaminopimelate desuccinylase-like protein
VSLRDEAVELLQALIRLDTVNPPGNETQAADLLRGYLQESGVSSELYARAPERANLVARIPGRSGGPRLILLSHTDTVLAEPREWQVDPWSGDLRDGHVWGRGALDMKGQVAASAVAIASLARDGFVPAGDLIFVACADEEVGEDPQYGLPWLCQHHPDAVEAEYAVNEGAGDRMELPGGRVVYLCSTAEKRSSPLKLIVHGRSGHGSKPGIADNALVKAAPLVERLGSYRPDPVLGPEVEEFLHVLLGEVPPAEEAVARAREVSEFAADTIEPLLSLTVSPTMIDASAKRNVIPGRCEVTVDTRLLPGQTEDEAEPLIREALGAGDYDLEWGQGYGGTRSRLDPLLWDAVGEFVRDLEGADVAPICVAGFTDSHWLRERFGTVAYGFFPYKEMAPDLQDRLIHSADERIPVDDLEHGVEFLRHVARRVGGSG